VPPHSIPAGPSPTEEDDDNEGDGDDDEGGEDGGEVMKDTTRPTEEDGILSFEELKELYAVGKEGGEVKSLYDEAWRMGGVSEEDEARCFGARENPVRLEKGEKGWGEANWTSFTP